MVSKQSSKKYIFVIDSTRTIFDDLRKFIIKPIDTLAKNRGAFFN
ncbi:hypothetical protein JL09_g6779 [Pichia kudriavzevii]|uniref:Uncharacterized protein n=1 Tax=Pichia kudriavzevii TaxID=4909 RepID=A0A099NKH0_PICKU|nr:hypothetical protein JL09_g6779 [Pichia kudriavzevii]